MEYMEKKLKIGANCSEYQSIKKKNTTPKQLKALLKFSCNYTCYIVKSNQSET